MKVFWKESDRVSTQAWCQEEGKPKWHVLGLGFEKGVSYRTTIFIELRLIFQKTKNTKDRILLGHVKDYFVNTDENDGHLE